MIQTTAKQLSPLPVPPLLPVTSAAEDDDGEEGCDGQGTEEDDDDGHGVRWRDRG